MMSIDYHKELARVKESLKKADKRASAERRKSQKWKRRVKEARKVCADIAREAERLRTENVRLNKDIADLQQGFMVLERSERND